jgi:hypothetical protein
MGDPGKNIPVVNGKIYVRKSPRIPPVCPSDFSPEAAPASKFAMIGGR